jgi:hypothetical protein
LLVIKTAREADKVLSRVGALAEVSLCR